MALTRGTGSRLAVQTTTISGETVDIPAFLAVSSTLPATGAGGYTDRSGSITTANTAQTVAPLNATRSGMTFQNTSDTAMRLTENGVDATATTGYLIAAGAAVNISTSDKVSVFCTVAGKTFAATEY
ncbi:MAG TPA: hypothetical protein VF638_00770 [Sphingomonas sp.]|jgi:hypothetical protein